MYVRGETVYYWADGSWCYKDEFNESEFAFKSDDYAKLDVSHFDSESQIDTLVSHLTGYWS